MATHKSTLLERMPVLDETTYSGRRAGSLPASVLTSGGTPAKIPNGVAKPAGAAPLVDLLDLSSDGTPVPSSSGNDFLNDLLGVDLSFTPSQPGANQAPNLGTDALLDLLSIGSPGQSSSPTVDSLTPSKDDKCRPLLRWRHCHRLFLQNHLLLF
ncbi:unnamed protein product [Rhodiola kirilowii]